MNTDLDKNSSFVSRHIGPDKSELESMLEQIGVSSLDELIDSIVPSSIRMKGSLNLPGPISEFELLNELKHTAKLNKVYKSYIGMGYYDCITPGVIQRNILENPGWYTQYTPYQAEISQGRLEALINFQTMVSDLTGMEIANASLLDEGTAAAEAMTMLHRAKDKKIKGKDANIFFVSDKCFPQTIDILRTRAEPLGISLVVGDHQEFDFDDEVFGALVQYPGAEGEVDDYSYFVENAHDSGILVAVAADLLSLTLLTPPGEFGADVAVGSTQRFGVPLGYGGPHAAYIATFEKFARQIPGRIIGVSIDSKGDPAYRMALQTREQHIRREKATSNICTAQALLAIMAGMYAVYHGPEGLKAIAERIHKSTRFLESHLQKLGYNQTNDYYFDTLKIDLGDNSGERIQNLKSIAEKEKINFRYIDERHVGISLDETTELSDVKKIIRVFAALDEKNYDMTFKAQELYGLKIQFPKELLRRSEFLTHQVYNKYHTETKMVRYIKRLENKDLSLTSSMIPLGSCTMKLNATTEMVPLTWPEFSRLHPFVPKDQAKGYIRIFRELEGYLSEITGLPAVSLQPNSGAQGEYAGLMVIRAYHADKGEGHRDVVLIPSSAHGTNPASAAMAGMKVVVVKCDDQGNVDVESLREKAGQYKDALSAIMVTYPSTHGVFEEGIKEICSIIHENGGQVYMDGANMNAQVGLTSPSIIGADVCHINLHKTFSIPHGGGGPGMGPICVAKHLSPYLPGHCVVELGDEKSISAVSSTPWGSSSIMLVSYIYTRLLGWKGVTDATKYAILNANYMKSKLERFYSVLYTGTSGRVAHEFILDLRTFKKEAGIDVEDVAKRLMDYSFHAPTISWPVAGTMMIEPTESEAKDELDRFCEALIYIYKEIREVADGTADRENNVLKCAPHTAKEIASDKWNHPYSRKKAVYPLPYLKENKFWPPVSRIDNPYGDRNLVCSCPPVESYENLPLFIPAK
ncbi:MAG: aminomethyl-transferring glycine dehydrogenase [Candidatus Dadabacteria bacterium]|nr:aminomethyl-transferring glycine dehydrogenase [Candidatus Dadabacteria bacterium]